MSSLSKQRVNNVFHLLRGNKNITTQQVKDAVANLIKKQNTAKFNSYYLNLDKELKTLVLSKLPGPVLSQLAFELSRDERNERGDVINELREKRLRPIIEAIVNVAKQFRSNLQITQDIVQSLHLRSFPDRYGDVHYDILCKTEGNSLVIVTKKRNYDSTDELYEVKPIKVDKRIDEKLFEVNIQFSSEVQPDYDYNIVVTKIMQTFEADIKKSSMPYSTLFDMKPFGIMASILHPLSFAIPRRMEIYYDTDIIKAINVLESNIADKILNDDDDDVHKKFVKHVNDTALAFSALKKVLSQVQTGGGLKLKRTQETIHILGRERSIFLNANRKKFITYKRAYVPLTAARKMIAKP
jgi:hypothetical protein